MKSIFTRLILLLIQTLLYSNYINCESENKWIDPFKVETLHLKDDKDNKSTKSNDGMSYYKRTINLILASLVQETADSLYQGRLYVDLSTEDYQFLKNFANINIDEPLILQRVDHILTNSITTSKIDYMLRSFSSWSDYVYYVIFNRFTSVLLTIFLILIVTYKLLRTNYSLYHVICYLIAVGYVIDFTFTWKRLLQELEIKKYADSLKFNEMPKDCKLSQMSGWQFILSYFSSRNDCKEYHTIILYDVFWDVGPLDVISHQLGKMLTIFGGNIGIALSKLTSGLMSELPFLLNITLLPILLIFVLALVYLILNATVSYKKHTSELDRGLRKIDAREKKQLEEIKQQFKEMQGISYQKRQPAIEPSDKLKREKDKRIGFSTHGKYRKIFQQKQHRYLDETLP